MSFLEKVIEDLDIKNKDLNKLCFVLPNKRSAGYFKKLLLRKIEKATFIPEIQSINSFMAKISGLNEVDEKMLIFTLYQSYIELDKNTKKDSFEDFNAWGIKLLRDVSAIEQNLLSPQLILKELIEINKINNWTKQELSDKQKPLFWEILPKLYSLFRKKLINNETGTKGMCYAEAKENLEHYKEANKNLKHVFIGLNALTKSEELIIQELLDFNNGEIYWDIDKEFLKNKDHGASFFIRQYRSGWKRFKNNPFKWEGEDYKTPKNINIIGTPKLLGQAMETSRILTNFDRKKLKNTIVVLGDEAIIDPFLNYNTLPLKDIEITVKKKLNLEEFKTLISEIFKIQQSSKKRTIQQGFKKLRISRLFKSAFPEFKKLEKKQLKTIQGLLKAWDLSKQAIDSIKELLIYINAKSKKGSIDFLHTEHCIKSLEETECLINKFSFFKDLKILKSVLFSSLENVALNFENNEDAKVQIMGLLESRALDFENVIITSVNEGTLPKGKMHSSLIPYDLRKKHSLLTYSERDAIYTYHFYRLIKRAKNIYLIYNNYNEGVMGGEKSRFIHQIEFEEKHPIVVQKNSSKIFTEKKDFILEKSPAAITKLNELAQKGFSPSTLEQYIKNQEEFYYKTLLNIYDFEEDKISPRVIGLVFHQSIEEIYRPLIGKKIKKRDMLKAESVIEEKIKGAFFNNGFKKLKKGKTLIIYEVIKNGISTLIKNEIKDIDSGNEIELVALEAKMNCELKIKGLDNPVQLRGVVDRIDIRNGTARIIDYKTGVVRPNEVVIKDIDFCLDVTNTKSMQLMCYALMYFKNFPKCDNIEAGLISFRDLRKGFMKFGVRQSGKEMDHLIDKRKVDDFEKNLKKLILEIMDPKINFKKEIQN